MTILDVQNVTQGRPDIDGGGITIQGGSLFAVYARGAVGHTLILDGSFDGGQNWLNILTITIDATMQVAEGGHAVAAHYQMLWPMLRVTGTAIDKRIAREGSN